MIRNAMFGLSLLALSAGSAFAGSSKHHVNPVVVADAKAAPAAPAADTAAPTDKPADKAEKKEKKAKKDKGTKTEKTEGAKEMAPTPAPAK